MGDAPPGQRCRERCPSREVVGLVASGHDATEILRLYPYLEAEDIREALAYAAWRSEEIEVPIPPP